MTAGSLVRALYDTARNTLAEARKRDVEAACKPPSSPKPLQRIRDNVLRLRLSLKNAEALLDAEGLEVGANGVLTRKYHVRQEAEKSVYDRYRPRFEALQQLRHRIDIDCFSLGKVEAGRRLRQFEQDLAAIVAPRS